MRKRVLSALACLVTLVVMLAPWNSGRDDGDVTEIGVGVVDCTDDVRVRSGPSYDAEIVAVLWKGQGVVVLWEEDGFYRIIAQAAMGKGGEVGGTVKGYVAAKLIILKKDEK